MKFILHVGPGKTGSSSIQAALLSQRETLSNVGILYPTAGRSAFGDFHLLADLASRGGEGCAVAVTSLNDAVAAIATEAKDLLSEIVVVSSDLFANLRPRALDVLRTALQSHSFEVAVVLYLRNLYTLALSTVQQQIRNGRHYENIFNTKPFTYFHLLQVYATAFGNDNLIIRTYYADPRQSASVVQDFYTHVLRTNMELVESNWENKSLYSRQLKYFNYFNNFFQYPSSPRNVKIVDSFRWAVMNMNIASDQKLSMSNAECKYLKEYFLYDKMLCIDLLPMFNIYDSDILDRLPVELVGLSFKATVCDHPSEDDLNNFMKVLSSVLAEPDFAGIFRAQQWKHADFNHYWYTPRPVGRYLNNTAQLSSHLTRP
jgi:hypothetical protein